MNTRTFLIATLIFFSLAPVALATVGAPCGTQGGSCQNYYCGSNTTLVDGSLQCGVIGFCCAPTSAAPAPGTPVSCGSKGGICMPSISCDGNTTVALGGTTDCGITQYCCVPKPAPTQTPAPASAPAPSSGTQTGTGNANTQIQTGTGNTGSTNTGTVVTLMNPLGNNVCSSNGTCLMNFLTSILKLVIQIGAVIVVLMLVYVGFLFVVAQGNESKLTTAKNALLWTVIGALVLLGAQAIASGIQATVQALGG